MSSLHFDSALLLSPESALTPLLEQSAAMHKHLCPRQVLGVRMGLHAGELLHLKLPQSNKRLFTFMETDGCVADGVSVATGCWVGRRTMRMIDFGKVGATFVDTRTSAAVRVWPRANARLFAGRYAPEGLSRWHTQLYAYQTMPVDELLVAEFVKLTVPLDEIISRAGVRVNCDRCGEEIINEREVSVAGDILCRACAGEAYYASRIEVSPCHDESVALAGL